MKLQTIRLHNFQSFGEAPTDIDLDDLTYLIGPNGSGKKAAQIALCRVFSIDPALRRVQRSSSEIRMPIGARSSSESHGPSGDSLNRPGF
jgi:putative ATP-dependent endonuclease of the OLD family